MSVTTTPPAICSLSLPFDMGVRVGTGDPGQYDAITDVAGVRVGHCTLIEGNGELVKGTGPVRTGVTVVLPHADGIWEAPVFAGSYVLNGNGEMTGLAWVNESGTLTSPVGLTNTHSVGVVRDTLVAIEVESRTRAGEHWALPVVGETWDGLLNDCDGFHVHPAHVRTAYALAADGPVEQGNVGGGTGMVCHGFKGGIGTASRRAGDYTVGVLVQANHGRRDRLSINGAPVGRHLDETEVPPPSAPGTLPYLQAGGSIICVVATDAPLLPHQCNRMAQRASLGVARTGGAGENSSGDLFLAFATGNRLSTEPAEATDAAASGVLGISMLPDARIDPLFYAAIEATEQAIVNALSAAQTMTGRDGITAVRLPPDRLREILDRHESYDHRR